jgi:hypothetical protein
VLVRGKEAAIVRTRIDAARQIGFDTLPDWLKA